jgi:hypothetical protein
MKNQPNILGFWGEFVFGQIGVFGGIGYRFFWV